MGYLPCHQQTVAWYRSTCRPHQDGVQSLKSNGIYPALQLDMSIIFILQLSATQDNGIGDTWDLQTTWLVCVLLRRTQQAGRWIMLWFTKLGEILKTSSEMSFWKCLRNIFGGKFTGDKRICSILSLKFLIFNLKFCTWWVALLKDKSAIKHFHFSNRSYSVFDLFLKLMFDFNPFGNEECWIMFCIAITFFISLLFNKRKTVVFVFS